MWTIIAAFFIAMQGDLIFCCSTSKIFTQQHNNMIPNLHILVAFFQGLIWEFIKTIMQISPSNKNLSTGWSLDVSMQLFSKDKVMLSWAPCMHTYSFLLWQVWLANNNVECGNKERFEEHMKLLAVFIQQTLINTCKHCLFSFSLFLLC